MQNLEEIQIIKKNLKFRLVNSNWNYYDFFFFDKINMIIILCPKTKEKNKKNKNKIILYNEKCLYYIIQLNEFLCIFTIF